VGIPFQEAITDASKSRLEAIFLTTSATIIGMLPITFYDETWQGLGAALIFGLSTSTVLTLLLVPIVFNLLLPRMRSGKQKISYPAGMDGSKIGLVSPFLKMAFLIYLNKPDTFKTNMPSKIIKTKTVNKNTGKIKKTAAKNNAKKATSKDNPVQKNPEDLLREQLKNELERFYIGGAY